LLRDLHKPARVVLTSLWLIRFELFTVLISAFQSESPRVAEITWLGCAARRTFRRKQSASEDYEHW